MKEIQPLKMKKTATCRNVVAALVATSCYRTIFTMATQVRTAITTINAVVNLRACSSVAVTVTDPVKLLLAVKLSMQQRNEFSGVFK